MKFEKIEDCIGYTFKDKLLEHDFFDDSEYDIDFWYYIHVFYYKNIIV